MTYEEAQAKIKKFIELHKDKNIRDVIPNAKHDGKVSDLVNDGSGDWHIRGDGYLFWASREEIAECGKICFNSWRNTTDTSFNIDDYLVEEVPYIYNGKLPLGECTLMVDGTYDVEVKTDTTFMLDTAEEVYIHDFAKGICTSIRKEILQGVSENFSFVRTTTRGVVTLAGLVKSEHKVFVKCAAKEKPVAKVPVYTMEDLVKMVGHDFKIGVSETKEIHKPVPKYDINNLPVGSVVRIKSEEEIKASGRKTYFAGEECYYFDNIMFIPAMFKFCGKELKIGGYVSVNNQVQQYKIQGWTYTPDMIAEVISVPGDCK